MSRWRAMLPLTVLIVTGIALLVAGEWGHVGPSDLLARAGPLRAAIAAHPLLARTGFVAGLALAIATGVPGTIAIVIAGGLWFGAVEGTLLSSVALLTGSLVLYAASRAAFRSGRRQPPAIARRLRQGYARRPIAYAFMLRFVPVVPLGVMTIALAWLRCPLWLFVIATWTGGTFSLAIESAIGAGMDHAIDAGGRLSAPGLSDPRLLLPVGAFLVVALLPMVIRRWRQRDAGRR